MGKSLAEQAIEQSIIEESAERARRGGSRTLAEHALDQEAAELRSTRVSTAPETRMRAIEITRGHLTIRRLYPEGDLIWELPIEKRERKAIADSQRELSILADELSREQVVIRG
jgi:hypothetical protein